MRTKECIDNNWFFHRGDVDDSMPNYKNIAYISAKTERKHIGPACKDYFVSINSSCNDKEHKHEIWENVNLPHDYLVGDIPSKENNSGLGYVKYDNAWYIKKLNFAEEDKNKRITLYFEGISTTSTIYFNGCLMKHNFCGYTSFEVDLTDMIMFDKENTLSVYVNTKEHESWWYEGAGITRHVFLIKTDFVSLDLYGLYAAPKMNKDKKWTVVVENTVRNDFYENKDVTIVNELIDVNGNIIATAEEKGLINDREIEKLYTQFDNLTPNLWSPDSPYQYTMRAKIKTSTTYDEVEVKFGFRNVIIDPNKGLFINDKKYIIKGVCGHGDAGLFGRAVPDNISRYKVKLIKEMGANGYRCSHYPQQEAFMDALDENGFIVMDETRWFESTEEGKAQLEMVVKRDRNRPGVIFWSVGNEEPYFATEAGRRICKNLMNFVYKFDKTRFIMTAVDRPDNSKVYYENTVLGINYNLESYDKVHELFPDKGIFASECCATGTTRGWYFQDDLSKGYICGYDHTPGYFMSREKTWKFLMSREWIMGGYQWTGLEYRGEARWPAICSRSGAIDLFLQKKDAFYQNQSHWIDEPMIHLLPHWNFKGMENEIIDVWAYTNTEGAELFLNNVSLGKVQVEKYGHAEWKVPYVEGKLEVVGYIGGKVVAKDTKVTSSSPYKLMLKQDNFDVKANGKDYAIVTCYVVDENGNEVPDASEFVSFTTIGDCKVYSTGSDTTDHNSLFETSRKMYAGKISIAVSIGTDTSKLKLVALSSLGNAVLDLKTN